MITEKQNQNQKVDLRKAVLVDGEIVRVGVPEWTDTRSQTADRIDGLINAIVRFGEDHIHNNTDGCPVCGEDYKGPEPTND